MRVFLAVALRERRRVPRVQEMAGEAGWLAAAVRGGAGADLIPGPGDPYFSRCLDHAAGDRCLAWLAGP